jgi:hypothetical protein
LDSELPSQRAGNPESAGAFTLPPKPKKKKKKKKKSGTMHMFPADAHAETHG